MDPEVLSDLSDRRLRIPVKSDLDDVVAKFFRVGLWNGVYPSRLVCKQARLGVTKPCPRPRCTRQPLQEASNAVVVGAIYDGYTRWRRPRGAEFRDARSLRFACCWPSFTAATRLLHTVLLPARNRKPLPNTRFSTFITGVHPLSISSCRDQEAKMILLNVDQTRFGSKSV